MNAATGTAPRVVVCVPTYNAAATIEETVASILRQTFENLEVHVCDNASTDGTLALLSKIEDKRLHVHAHGSNVGAEGNFTRCMQRAAGDYTCIYHADDVYDPNIVERQVHCLESDRSLEAVLCQAWTIDDASRVIGSIDMIPPIPPGAVARYDVAALLKNLLRHRNRVVISSLMVRSSVFRDHIPDWGGLRFRSASDVDMYLRLAARAPLAVIGDRLIRYRISESQYSQRIRNRVERPDFFLVGDAYVHSHRGVLTNADRRHYRWLKRHDDVARALNALIAGDVDRGRSLVEGALSLDALHAALRTRLGLVSYLAAAFVKSMSSLGLLKYSIKPIRWAKVRRWK